MGYHAASFSRPEKPHYRVNGENRTRWQVVTQWYENSQPDDSDAYTKESEDHKILRWESNDTVVPADIMAVATGTFGEKWPYITEMDAARDAQLSEFAAQYRAARARRTPEQRAEERFEMRAAFGEDETVVDVLTGERTKL